MCDNQSLLKAVNRWIGEGGKATLAGAPDADILAAAIEILRKKIAAGTATFMVKVKAHQGGPANKGADIQADKAISDPKIGKQWCQRTNRAVFTWKNLCCEAGKVTYQDHHSAFDNSVSDAIRRRAAENEVPKHNERLTGAWRQMSTLRRRYAKWCKGDDIVDCTHMQRYEASYQSMVKVMQQKTWIDDKKFLKSCVRARAEQGNINHPAYGTSTLRQNESRAFLRKYLNDPRVPWRHRRQELMAIAGIIPVAKWLAKIKAQSDVSCRLCKGHEKNAVRALRICRKRHMGTSTVLSAMEWRQPSRLPTTSSGDICMLAYKLYKHQRVRSGLSHLIKSAV